MASGATQPGRTGQSEQEAQLESRGRESDCHTVAPAPPAEAAEQFGDRLHLMNRYAQLLANVGVQRGLIGPREVERIWDRHLLNCAALSELIPYRSWVVDVGSGSGLPGVVLAIARPDLDITLLEPLLRRTVFLEECAELLALRNVEVLRGRAEEWAGRLKADVVTARAVAPMERLVGWCLPLLRAEGAMLALKGDAAGEELASVQSSLAAQGARAWRVVEVGGTSNTSVARVIQIELGASGYRTTPARRRPARRPRG